MRFRITLSGCDDSTTVEWEEDGVRGLEMLGVIGPIAAALNAEATEYCMPTMQIEIWQPSDEEWMVTE